MSRIRIRVTNSNTISAGEYGRTVADISDFTEFYHAFGDKVIFGIIAPMDGENTE